MEEGWGLSQAHLHLWKVLAGGDSFLYHTRTYGRCWLGEIRMGRISHSFLYKIKVLEPSMNCFRFLTGRFDQRRFHTMVRIKMPLRMIEGEKHRNNTFVKRRVVIKKKAMELGKLCDIDTLLVCFGPRGQLETWPEEADKVCRMIRDYRSLRPDECIKRRYDIATFFECHLKKLQAELARARESWLDNSPPESLEELLRSLDSKLATIEDRIGSIGHLGLEEESRGKEMEVWNQHDHNQLQHMQEGMPQLPLGTILDAQPIQSLEGFDFSRVKREKFKGNGLQGHAAAVAGAAAWAGPHDLQRSHIPCTLTHTAPDPYMLPMIQDHSFNVDMGYLDDLIFPSPFLAMDFSTYPTAVGGASTSSLVDSSLDPAIAAFPLPFAHDAPLVHGGGGGGSSSSTGNIRNSNMALPSFDHPVLDPGYGFSLHHLTATNTTAMCNEVFHRQNELYGGDFHQGVAHTAGTSLADAWPTPIFLDLPPTGCGGSDSAQAVVPPGRGNDSSEFMPASATNPYT